MAKKSQNKSMTIFEGSKIRRVWDDEKELWFFSVVDVVGVLAQNDRPRKYWDDLKRKLKQEGSEVSEKIGQLKLQAEDGKMRETDVVDTEGIFRIIQSIPSPKAEPFKLWLARVGGGIACNARKQIEAKTGKPVISKLSFKKIQGQKKLKGK